MKEKDTEGPVSSCSGTATRKWRRVPHREEPDFTRPLLSIPREAEERILGRLSLLYGGDEARKWLPELERILKVYHAYKTPTFEEAEKDFNPEERFSEKDMILITYGDLVRSEGRSPLATLAYFMETADRLRGVINTIHILPFFPYTSDRGFSVTDFKKVDPNLGSWTDVEEIGRRFKLMFDGVLNHVSANSPQIQEMLHGNPEYRDVAIVFRSPDELTPEQRKIIVRPRTSKLLTEFQSIDGPVWLWTTFSADQVDLNYRNPKVLMQMVETLLLYVRKGADIIRLDAVTYLWAEPGTPSVHLTETHEIIKLIRDVLDLVAPHVVLLTETNVPHEENISYFGNGSDEAQMVYNFALPPMVLHTFYSEDTTALSRWANDLSAPSHTTTFLNFLDSHDGVGVMGVKNILKKEEIDRLIRRAKEHGAFISYKSGKDGKEPYEINTTWWSVINMDNSGEEISFQVRRFVASRSIPLVLSGVPGIYFHGLIGTSSDIHGVLESRSKRDINRRVIYEKELLAEVDNPASKLSHIRRQLVRILEIRVRFCAFHPNGLQKVLMASHRVFTVLRVSPDARQHILTMTNVTNRAVKVDVPLEEVGVSWKNWYDLIGKRGWRAKDKVLSVLLQPYDVAWLIPFAELEEMIKS
ncbi:MAG: sugar phosphorylase [Deltaproteobacteria bacterium]|nr:sugar phosphorylase [Deltaproteobacteria bacterium]MBW2048433.1 sugar phosphorylase [Deltaproteobacteria bacterium]MBW2110403.1 sugar phosphorylase [Deltaproteobacteria bacterium]MBW2351986.1 sugar phosphorylase [Deltaproteobacteria bacterium]HDZ90965.1 sugar phosphorylase [Deltaproteobacteria bacterium]